MALGDADLRVFFRGGDPLSFSGVSTYPDGQPVQGHVENTGKDAIFDQARVADVTVRVELPWNAFKPSPKSGDALEVLAGRLAGTYKVREVNPLGDGAIIELLLRVA